MYLIEKFYHRDRKRCHDKKEISSIRNGSTDILVYEVMIHFIQKIIITVELGVDLHNIPGLLWGKARKSQIFLYTTFCSDNIL